MRGVYHMAGFLKAEAVKIFDIGPHYRDCERQDMLVSNGRLGSALATMFGSEGKPIEAVVLMRKHGFTAVAENLVTTVYRAIYTRINAEVQTKTLALARDVYGERAEQGGFDGLTPLQGDGCLLVCEQYQGKPWRLWVREVREISLYKNSLGSKKQFTGRFIGEFAGGAH